MPLIQLFTIVLFPLVISTWIKMPGFYNVYFLDIIMINLIILRTYYNGDKRFNVKPFIFSMISALIFYIGFDLVRIFIKSNFSLSIYKESAIVLGEIVFLTAGIISFSFLAFNICKYGWGVKGIYRLIEFSLGGFFIMYKFEYFWALAVLKIAFIPIVLIQVIYLGLYFRSKYLDYKLIKAARRKHRT